jgi:hypothetical protein
MTRSLLRLTSHYWTIIKAAANMRVAKMGVDRSRVSTFVFQFGIISSLTL